MNDSYLGRCRKCCGSGRYIEYICGGYDKNTYVCPECDGLGFVYKPKKKSLDDRLRIKNG
jgi:hypothetical protein